MAELVIDTSSGEPPRRLRRDWPRRLLNELFALFVALLFLLAGLLVLLDSAPGHRWIVDRIAGLSNVEVLTQTNVTGLEGRDGVLEAIRWRQKSAEEVRIPIQHLFLFIGADPNTNWLSGSGIALDAKGFVLTGGDCDEIRNLLETSRSGIFAIGDVRSGSIKRVAAAVGEGAQAVAALHSFLASGAPRIEERALPDSSR